MKTGHFISWSPGSLEWCHIGLTAQPLSGYITLESNAIVCVATCCILFKCPPKIFPGVSAQLDHRTIWLILSLYMVLDFIISIYAVVWQYFIMFLSFFLPFFLWRICARSRASGCSYLQDRTSRFVSSPAACSFKIFFLMIKLEETNNKFKEQTYKC